MRHNLCSTLSVILCQKNLIFVFKNSTSNTKNTLKIFFCYATEINY